MQVCTCSLVRLFTSRVPFSVQVNRWLVANQMLGEPWNGLGSCLAGEEVFSLASKETQDRHPPAALLPVASNADFFLFSSCR